jgi:hypothetical protein
MSDEGFTPPNPYQPVVTRPNASKIRLHPTLPFIQRPNKVAVTKV